MKDAKIRLRSAASQNKKNNINITKYNSNKNLKTNEKKNTRNQIRPKSAYHTNNKEERKQIIKPINLFNNIFINYIKTSGTKKTTTNKINKKGQEENKKNKEEISLEKEEKRKIIEKKKKQFEEIKKLKKDEENKKKTNKKSKVEKVDIFKYITNLKINLDLKKSKEDNNKEEEKEGKDKLSKKPNSIFDRDLCDKIVSSLPKREKTTLKEFKKTIKSKTENLSEKEKAFILFKWMGQNIDYDVKNKNLGKRVDCSKEGVFRTGKTVCSGYSNLFEHIALYLNLKVESVPCYAKRAGYIPERKYMLFQQIMNIM